VVGEHGDSEVAVWSCTSIGGLRLANYCDKCGKCFGHPLSHLEELHAKVKNAAYVIIQKKGATNYAIALAVQRIISAILNDERSILTVSTLLNQQFGGALDDLYLSLPTIVGKEGIAEVLEPDYSEEEKKAIIASGLALKEKLKDLPL
jgi:L-lactate dehydrogenase